jgi:hypothetical protein
MKFKDSPVFRKFVLKHKLMEQVEAAIEAALREMDPKPPEPGLKRL